MWLPTAMNSSSKLHSALWLSSLSFPHIVARPVADEMPSCPFYLSLSVAREAKPRRGSAQERECWSSAADVFLRLPQAHSSTTRLVLSSLETEDRTEGGSLHSSPRASSSQRWGRGFQHYQKLKLFDHLQFSKHAFGGILYRTLNGVSLSLMSFLYCNVFVIYNNNVIYFM